ncbi:MAG: hypothetical protein ACE5H1_02975, partial [Thermodesulfobacteriota bacterium]
MLIYFDLGLRWLFPICSIFGGIGKFLFGSDPGKKSRKALEQFGIEGGPIAKEFTSESQALLNSLLSQQGAQARQASGARLARAGLTGSGIAEDVLGNVDLNQAQATTNFLR